MGLIIFRRLESAVLFTEMRGRSNRRAGRVDVRRSVRPASSGESAAAPATKYRKRRMATGHYILRTTGPFRSSLVGRACARPTPHASNRGDLRCACYDSVIPFADTAL